MKLVKLFDNIIDAKYIEIYNMFGICKSDLEKFGCIRLEFENKSLLTLK